MAVSKTDGRSAFVDNWQSGKSLAECNLNMLTSEDSCDVSFRVGKDKKIVRAHRYVLISRSCVFHAMLCGPLAEKDEIKITDVEADIFSALLRYLYTDELYPNPENVTGLLYLAKKYAVGGLEQLCLTYLKSSLSAENACVILEQAHVFDENELYVTAMEVVLKNGDTCVHTESFKHLCRECFDKVIGSDQLAAKAEQIFSSALSWTEEESRRQGREVTPATLRSILGETLYMIPFHEMDQKHFVKEVIPRKILTSDEIVVITCHHTCPENDLAPFKQRQNRSKLVCRNDSPYIIFYNRHKKIRDLTGDEIRSKICFTPSQDIVVHGVFVFGSKRKKQQMYRLTVEQLTLRYISNWVMLSECCSSADTRFSDGIYMRTVCFEAPLTFKAGLRHKVSVTLIDRDELEIEGDDIIRNTALGQCVIKATMNSGCQSHNLIYGLILKR